MLENDKKVICLQNSIFEHLLKLELCVHSSAGDANQITDFHCVISHPR